MTKQVTEEVTEKSPMATRLENRMLQVGFPTKGRLSAASGVSRAIITNIVRRPEKEIWASVALRLCKTLNCRIEWLLEGTGSVTDERAEEERMVYGHCPKLYLNDLATKEIETLVIHKFEQGGENPLHCPTKASRLTVAIKAERKLGKIDAEDYLFIDLEQREPRAGQIVLARKRDSASTPEFYTYSTSMQNNYVRSFDEDLPPELRLIEITEDIEVLGSVVASTKIF